MRQTDGMLSQVASATIVTMTGTAVEVLAKDVTSVPTAMSSVAQQRAAVACK